MYPRARPPKSPTPRARARSGGRLPARRDPGPRACARRSAGLQPPRCRAIGLGSCGVVFRVKTKTLPTSGSRRRVAPARSHAAARRRLAPSPHTRARARAHARTHALSAPLVTFEGRRGQRKGWRSRRRAVAGGRCALGRRPTVLCRRRAVRSASSTRGRRWASPSACEQVRLRCFHLRPSSVQVPHAPSFHSRRRS